MLDPAPGPDGGAVTVKVFGLVAGHDGRDVRQVGDGTGRERYANDPAQDVGVQEPVVIHQHLAVVDVLLIRESNYFFYVCAVVVEQTVLFANEEDIEPDSQPGDVGGRVPDVQGTAPGRAQVRREFDIRGVALDQIDRPARHF